MKILHQSVRIWRCYLYRMPVLNATNSFVLGFPKELVDAPFGFPCGSLLNILRPVLFLLS